MYEIFGFTEKNHLSTHEMQDNTTTTISIENLFFVLSQVHDYEIQGMTLTIFNV